MRFLKLLTLPLIIAVAAVSSSADRNPFEFGSENVSKNEKRAAIKKLSMIIIRGENYKAAIFDGRIFKVGDRIGSQTVTKISLDRVVTDEGKRKFVYHLPLEGFSE